MGVVEEDRRGGRGEGGGEGSAGGGEGRALPVGWVVVVVICQDQAASWSGCGGNKMYTDAQGFSFVRLSFNDSRDKDVPGVLQFHCGCQAGGGYFRNAQVNGQVSTRQHAAGTSIRGVCVCVCVCVCVSSRLLLPLLLLLLHDCEKFFCCCEDEFEFPTGRFS